MSWRNDDGLLQKFGTEKATAQLGGMLSSMGDGLMVMEFDVDLAAAGSAAGAVANVDNFFIPTGAIIEKVTVIVTEETAGTNANWNLGLGYYKFADGTLTEKDYNGIIAAGDAFNAGTDIGLRTEYTQGSTEHGALIGVAVTTTTESGYADHDRFVLTHHYDTAAFTAGQLHVIIEYRAGAYIDVDG